MIRHLNSRCLLETKHHRLLKNYKAHNLIRHKNATIINAWGRNFSIGTLGTSCDFVLDQANLHYTNRLLRKINPLEEKQSNQSHILSCSMVSKNNELIESERIITKVIHKIIKSAQRLWDILMVLLRTTEISIRLSPLVILTPAAILASKRLDEVSHNNKNTGTSILSKVAWKYTLYTIQKLGPAFIKISQWASTRRDIFPHNICDRLSELNDGTFFHSWDHTHKVLCKSLGTDYRDWLEINENDIIGSGSVAQVYTGLWKGQKRVAVKVLHPNIHEHVERDLLLMMRAADIIG